MSAQQRALVGRGGSIGRALDRDVASSNKFPLLPWEISFTPRDLCLSDDTLLVVGSFYLVCMQAKD